MSYLDTLYGIRKVQPKIRGGDLFPTICRALQHNEHMSSLICQFGYIIVYHKLTAYSMIQIKNSKDDIANILIKHKILLT